MAASSIRRLVARKAATKRHHPNADTTDLDRDLAAAKLADYIESVVSTAPTLSVEQRDRLATLLRGAA